MIKLIVVGKLKESYLKEGILDYQKRISKYHRLEIIEIIDSDILEEESKILKCITDRDYVVTLEILGNKINSVDFSKKLGQMLMQNSNMAFVIGGSYGLADEVKKRSNYALSFSDFTFPHGLFRLVFLEQLYRGFKILNNETYHK